MLFCRFPVSVRLCFRSRGSGWCGRCCGILKEQAYGDSPKQYKICQRQIFHFHNIHLEQVICTAKQGDKIDAYSDPPVLPVHECPENTENAADEHIPFMHGRQEIDADHGAPQCKQYQLLIVPDALPGNHKGRDHEDGKCRPDAQLGEQVIITGHEHKQIGAVHSQLLVNIRLRPVNVQRVGETSAGNDGWQIHNEEHQGNPQKVHNIYLSGGKIVNQQHWQEENCLELKCQSDSVENHGCRIVLLHQEVGTQQQEGHVDEIALPPERGIQEGVGNQQQYGICQ